MGICNCVLEYMKSYDRLRRYYAIEQVFYFRTTNEHSLTHASDFYTYKIIEGLVYNTEHVVNTCKHLMPFRFVSPFVTYMMVKLYGAYLASVKEAPEFAEKNLVNLRYFYQHVYKRYEKVNFKALHYFYNKELRYLMSLTSKTIPRINISRFIKEISQ